MNNHISDPILDDAGLCQLLRLPGGADLTIERMVKNGDLPIVELTGRGELGGRRLKRIRRESLDTVMKKRERTEYTPSGRRRKHEYVPDFIGND